MTSTQGNSLRNSFSENPNAYIHSLDKSQNQSYVLGKDGSLQVSKSKNKLMRILSSFFKSKRENPEEKKQINQKLSEVIKFCADEIDKLDHRSLKIIGDIYLTYQCSNPEKKLELTTPLLNAIVFSEKFKLSELIQNKDQLEKYIIFLKHSKGEQLLTKKILFEFYQLSEKFHSRNSFKDLLNADSNCTIMFSQFFNAKSKEFVDELVSEKNPQKLLQKFHEMKQMGELLGHNHSDYENVLNDLIKKLPPDAKKSLLKNALSICKFLNDSSITNVLFEKCFSDSLKFGKAQKTEKSTRAFLEPWLKDKALEKLTSLNIGDYDCIFPQKAFEVLVDNMPNLEKLNLGGLYNRAGIRSNQDLEFLASHCKKLKELNLNYQMKIDDDGIIKILENCKDLELLDLSGADSVQNEDGKLFNALSKHTKLQELRFNYNKTFIVDDIEFLKKKLPNVYISSF